MIRSSRSEFGASDLMPPEVALGIRVRLRQMRFGQPQEYAQMEQNEVRKFLSSKSVHNWLSEWNLSHTFSVANRENTLDRRRNRKADVCVQCTGELIDAALGLRCAVPPAPSSVPLAPFANGAVLACHKHLASERNFPLIPLASPRICHPPSLMNASTNTQTTETTRTSGGTGGRMHVFRRASLLEEYAQKTLQKLEEREEEERQQSSGRKRWESKEKDRAGGRGRRRGRGCLWWTGKCCGGRETESSGESADEEQQRDLSVADATADGRPTKASAAASSDDAQREGRRTKIVKRFTISNWAGGGHRAMEAHDETSPKGTKWRRKAEGWGGGDYDNVPEEWRGTDGGWEESQQRR